MEREYIKINKPSPFVQNILQLRTLDDKFWKSWVFYHLLHFYQNYDCIELKLKIEEERGKQYPRIERGIAKYIRLKLNANKEFGLHFSAKGEVTNDEDIEGNYDVNIHSTNWKSKDFFFECKNLDGSQDSVNKYVAYNTYRKNETGLNIYDGGCITIF